MKNILIIGGSYFAGRAAAEMISEQVDINVFVFNRGNIPLGLKKVTQFKGDRTDPESVQKNIPNKHWDAVIDFCAYTPDDIDNVFNAVCHNTDQYIFISSTSVYDHMAFLPMNEDSLTIDASQPWLGEYADYGLDKVRAEQRLQALCVKQKTVYTILRPSIIYGRFNYAPRESYFFEQIDKEQPLTVPENDLSLFSFIYVEDLAKIIFKCISNKNAADKIFNVSAPELFSYRRYIRILKQVVQKDIKMIEISLTDIDKNGITLPFPINHHQIYAANRLQKALEFEFTPLLFGLKKTYMFHQLLMEKKEAQNGCI